jgi:uncharacterized protein
MRKTAVTFTLITAILLIFGGCKNKVDKEPCYSRKDMKLCKKLCDDRDTRACRVICLKTNDFSICKKACNFGSHSACMKLRKMKSPSRKKTKEVKKERPGNTLESYQKDCDSGKTSFCTFVADRYAEGIGVKINNKKAMEYYKKACIGGVAKGCTYLGDYYVQGKAVPKDSQMGRTLLERGCTGDHKSACHMLGLIYLKGEDVPINIKKARKFLDKACKGDVQTSCYVLGAHYIMKNGKKNKDKGLNYLLEACRGGVADSCLTMGNFYEKGRFVKKDIKKAHFHYEKACSGGISNACDVLKTFHEKYKSTFTLDTPKKMEASCLRGSPQACTFMGDYYGRGYQVGKNLTKARTYLKKGCKLSNKRACALLKEFHTIYK